MQTNGDILHTTTLLVDPFVSTTWIIAGFLLDTNANEWENFFEYIFLNPVVVTVLRYAAAMGRNRNFG